MSEHREGTLFYDTETGRYDIPVLIWNLFMEDYIAGNVSM